MASDPYKYFKVEAREILSGLGAGVIELEKGAYGKERINTLLRLAHTLKGASRVVKQPGIATLAHAIEDVLQPYRSGELRVESEHIRLVLESISAVSSLVDALDSPPSQSSVTDDVPRHPYEPTMTVRVDVHEMDALLEGITETGVSLRALGQSSAALARLSGLTHELRDTLSRLRVAHVDGESMRVVMSAQDTSESLAEGIDAFSRSFTARMQLVRTELVQVRDAAHQLRLIPASTLFGPLERAARDAAHAVGKSIEFRSSGGDVRLDLGVTTAIRDALLHVVINAVAHGVESARDRVAAGKPNPGALELIVERRGDAVAFVCRDDGRGIDVEAIRRVAVQRGIVAASAASSLGLDEVVKLLLAGGLSTASSLSDVSGRGIGLDVVRTITERLRGTVRIRSEVGIGTTVDIEVPIALSSVEALMVEAGGIAASIPLHAVQCAVRVTEADVARTPRRDSIVHEGQVIPFVPLERALRRRPNAAREKRSWSSVVVHAGGQAVAMGVDRLLGTAMVVVTKVPARFAADPIVGGASLDADGNPELVLDPSELVRSILSMVGTNDTAQEIVHAPILVIDDSLTTRMLEQSILESAGYSVELASSADEALAKAKAAATRYSLFLCDVEMPGMDGFEFVSRTRADPELKHVPAILVTSRSSPEDKQKGRDAGASAYIVKSEFDQGVLLEIIGRLVS